MKPENFLDIIPYREGLMKNMKAIEKELNCSNFNSEQLIQVCEFLGMEYIAGTYIMSSLVRAVVNVPRFLINF